MKDVIAAAQRAVDEYFNIPSGTSKYSDAMYALKNTLRTREEWVRARELAKQTLDIMNKLNIGCTKSLIDALDYIDARLAGEK